MIGVSGCSFANEKYVRIILLFFIAVLYRTPYRQAEYIWKLPADAEIPRQ